MRNWLRDLPLSIRQPLKPTVFTPTAALTLALGIGAAMAIFSIAEGALLRSMLVDAGPLNPMFTELAALALFALAPFVPARRVAPVEPIDALRSK